MNVNVNMDADVDGWESGHRAAYGCGAWERACHQGGVLVAWHEEQERGFGAPASRGFRAPLGPRAKWPWGSGPHTVALLLWRTAHDAGILVDEVLLADTLRHCDPAAVPLAAGPLPDAARKGGVGVGSAEAVAGVGHVLRAHIEAELPGPRAAGVRLTLGYRVREVLATPDWDRGDWSAALVLARQAMGRADDLRERGAWQPTARERSTWARVGPDRKPDDERAAPGGRVSGLLTRAARLVALADALSTDADTLPRDSHGGPGPLAQVLVTTARACDALRTSADELGRLWAAGPREPADPSSWELAHVPDALRIQTEETEDLLRAVDVFLWVLTCS
ncbi:hypothetical protein [Streptomyces sp. NPDC059668]|uniref:hypothetical protein n=1 Tax=Streptomyces sp. NPDC059668 TaxID=3346900 RepID=UPI0036B13727